VSVGTAVALVLALVSTTLINLAYLQEHDAAAELPVLSMRRPLHEAVERVAPQVLRLLLLRRGVFQRNDHARPGIVPPAIGGLTRNERRHSGRPDGE
jgi:hypothetical protein